MLKKEGPNNKLFDSIYCRTVALMIYGKARLLLMKKPRESSFIYVLVKINLLFKTTLPHFHLVVSLYVDNKYEVE